MINLGNKNEPFDLFQEGRIKDILKDSEIDVDKIKDDWRNAGDDEENGLRTRAEIASDTLKKGNRIAAPINNHLNKYHKVSTASIITRAKNSVLQFPIYMTGSIPYNAAHTISKMFERVYTTLVQTVLSQNQIIDEEEANNLVFLKRFHTNLKESVEVLVNKYYEAIDDVDKMMCESIFHTAQITENLFVEFRVVPTDDQVLIMENARLSNEPLQGFMYLREDLEEDVKTVEKGNVRTVENEGKVPEKILSDEELKQVARKMGIVYTQDHSPKKQDGKPVPKGTPGNIAPGQPNLDALRSRLRANKEVIMFKGRRIMARPGRNGEWEFYLPAVDGKTVTKDSDRIVDKKFRNEVEAPKLLKDSDIKKINGMLPYTIEATFRLRTAEGLDRDVKYVIGIKSIMHLISVKDLSEDLREIITGNIKSLQKVRYTTGEIGFKDYYFNIKGLKADAAKHINYDKRWLNTLKRLAEYDKMNGTLLKQGIKAITGGHVPIPNGTLVLSQGDVSKLANETGIDLSIVSNVKRLAKSLFLIGVVIIDSIAGTMRVIFPDSDSSWDVQSLSSIDAELSKTDNSQLMKELNRMVNK